MSKINYTVREDESETLIMADNEWSFLDTIELLEKYPYIIDSMKKEEYYLENEICSFFEEILFENKVVGFATFQLRNETAVLLSECYIMPEFRGNGLFLNEICKMNFVAPVFGILQPTRNIVELLLDYGFAKKVTDDIAVSALEFYFDDYDVRSSENRDLEEDEIEPSNFYDLTIKSTVFVDGDEVIYHNLLENDLKKHGPRDELNDDYFNSLKELFLQNRDEFDNLIYELKEELPQEKLGYDEIIGSGDELSDYMKGIVDDNLISHDKAIEIRQQLIREYESGEINDETIDERFTMLVAAEMSDAMNLDLLGEFLDSEYGEDDGAQVVKEFFEVIGDNEELTSSLFEAILSDDDEKFENLIINAMNEDEDFAMNFLDMVESFDDGDDLGPTPFGDELDLESLGLNLDSKYPVAEMMWGNFDDKYKLDDTFYGKDYPISDDIYIYRILDSLKMHNNLPFALATADMRGAATAQVIESFLFENEFIDDKVTYDNWDEFAHDSLTIPDLKNILRENNLRVSGKKQVLIDRIAENQIPLDEFRSEKVRVTPRGEEFLNNNEWIGFYDKFLNGFDFNDFVKYLDNNEGEFKEVTLRYLDEHLRLAQEKNDLEYINYCNSVRNVISLIDGQYFNILNDTN